MLVDIIGENGSGKNFIMTIFALSVPEKNILANFWINHPHFRYLELDDFLNIDNHTDVFIDEAYKWLENRRSMKSTNIFITEIKEQKRKTDSTWYVSQQRLNMIDKRFEENANILIECKTRYPIGYSTDDFNYKITFTEPYQVVYKTFPYEDAKKYFTYFNTNEKIEPENKQKLEYEFIKNNSEKLLAKVLKFAKLIEEKYPNDKYTHPYLKWCCLENNIIKEYEPWIYVYFQTKKEKEKNKGSA